MLQYLIKFSISLAVLFIFYRVVLRPLTFYQCNRFYLLCYSLLSFVIPFIDITPWVSGNNNTQLVNFIPIISNYTVVADVQPAEQLSFLQRLTTTDWLLIVFCMGALAMLVRIILQYFSLSSIRHKAVLLDTNMDVQLYETNAIVSPFSFGNAIYFNRQLHTEEELQRIIQHEFVHVKQKHTIDLLIGELLCVINWFNPFAWFIRYSIRQNLEFIADNNVVANGLDKKEYQYLLLKVIGVPQYSIANNFNFSNLKKRIAMMNKMKTPRVHLTKFLFVLPLMTVLFLAFRKNENNEKEKLYTAGTKLVTDTVPAPAPPPPPAITNEITARQVTIRPINKKGYIITIADNNGECVVLVKDKQQQIVKAITLTDWNKNKKENENQYGEIPPPPPPPPAIEEIIEVPASPEEAEMAEVPVAPAIAKLPPNVKEISMHTTIHNTTGTHINTVTVTLKNGTREIYNLNDPKEKASYIKKYGALPAPAPVPPVPVTPPKTVPLSAVDPVAAIRIKGSTQPLYVVDGVEKADIINANSIQADKIKSVHVLKDKSATNKYGEKGKNGVVEIVTIAPLYIVDSVVQPEVFDIKTIPQDKIQSINIIKDKTATDKYGDRARSGAVIIQMKKDSDYFPKDVLVIIDGLEIPAGAKINDYIKPGDIERMNVLKDKTATIKYGDKGKGGAIEIKTKTKKPVTNIN